MRVSMRVQLGVAIVLVTMTVVVLVLLTSQRRLVDEFSRFEGGSDTTQVAEAARRLEDWYPHVRVFTWPGGDSVLATVRRPQGLELVLQSSGGWVVAATSPELRHAEISGGEGVGLAYRRDERGGTIIPPGAPPPRPSAIVLTVRDNATGRVRRLLFDNPPRRVLRAPEGRTAGVVYSLYMPAYAVALDSPGRARGVSNRVLLVPLLLGGLATIALLLAASSRLLAPLRDLTEATRRLAGGDRAARVPVAGASEVAELAVAFNGMAESLERAESTRRQMATDVAHELRTPLANLRCRIEALQDGLAPADAAALQALHLEALLLGTLVEDLQLLSLADAGRLPLAIGRADARELAARAISATAPRAEAAGVTLALVGPGEVWAACDPERVGQMLRALLDNALAHTPRGGTVTVEVTAAGNAVTLDVRDTGAGIAPAHLAHVFECFWRADPARARERGGSGLGLAIVRQLAELQGGSVTATSTLGAGACFRVSLPPAGTGG